MGGKGNESWHIVQVGKDNVKSILSHGEAILNHDEFNGFNTAQKPTQEKKVQRLGADISFDLYCNACQ